MRASTAGAVASRCRQVGRAPPSVTFALWLIALCCFDAALAEVLSERQEAPSAAVEAPPIHSEAQPADQTGESGSADSTSCPDDDAAHDAPAPSFPSFASVASLGIDADGTLLSHWIIVASECDGVAAVMHEELLKHLPPAALEMRLGIADAELSSALGLPGCALTCVERGVDASLVPAAAAVRRMDKASADDRWRLRRWAETECVRVHIGFVNLLDSAATVRWLDADRPSEDLRTGGTNNGVTLYRHQSWHRVRLGERFELTSAEGERLLTASVRYSRVHIIGHVEPFDPKLQHGRDWEALVNATIELEQKRAQAVQTVYTATGSQVAPVPPAVWASISAYYHNNANNTIREEWQPTTDRAYVNFWEAAVFMVPLPPLLKREWHVELQELVSKWAGGVELEPTDLYGFRVYTKGAWLLPHVDREETHALSLVLNVAQHEMHAPWPLEVDDMRGGTNYAALRPGELVYYESARCLHARRSKLDGERFVNLFAHYRPKGQPKWFKQAERSSAAAAFGKLRHGDDVSFVLINESPDPMRVMWVSPSSELVLVDTFAADFGEMRINSKVGHSFVLRGDACEQKLDVTPDIKPVVHACGLKLSGDESEGRPPPPPRESMRPVGQGIKAAVIFVNDAPEPVRVYWMPPEGRAFEYVETLEPNASRTFNSFVGHSFRAEGGCTEVVIIGEDGETRHLCREMVPEGERLRRELDLVRQYSTMVSATFVNAASRELTVWWCGADGEGQGSSEVAVRAGGSYSLSTYPNHVFAVTESKASGSCRDSLWTFTPNLEQHVYLFDDGTGSPGVVYQISEAQKRNDEYLKRTGRHWVAHWDRKPVEKYMHPADTVGNEIVVTSYSPPIPAVTHAGGRAAEMSSSACWACGCSNLTLRVIATSPRAFVIENFLSDSEAEHLISHAGKIERSTTMSRVSQSRTSRNTWVRRNSSPVTERIFRRAAEVLGLAEEQVWDTGYPQHAESIQLVHYAPGQRYDAHYDWGVGAPETRFATLLLYLNDPEEGGKTAFPKATNAEPLAIHPGRGGAVLFYNLLEDGNADVNSLHAAMPVTMGEKWLANIWVWDPFRGADL